ncbi:DUF4097 family beta strand repeat-containing protein [Lederbergia lenta]|uniref:DUF4097 family beta strand repeat-containing protein n=1 Tax=Lederbergia lenta TaxID=1467 RepID=UPI00203C3A79|nr:DUF4097 family beta strand repeat-containing protein [Lederbergia lenta]MCM3112714.1 DUF4097 domain-containing protein [Lederbergia lenta]
MINVKNISIIALLLLLIGIVGSIITFKSLGKPEPVSEKRGIDDDQFTNINIVAGNAKVEILPTKDTKATAELSGKAKNYVFEANVEGNTLAVVLKEKHWKLVSFDFFSTALTLKVYVPEKQYDTIQIESNNGRFHAENLVAKEMNVKTDNGRIELENIESSTVKAEANNGRIELKSIKALSVAVEADNGKILLEDVDGKLSGKTNNGRISLVTNNLERQIDFATDNGSIKIQTEKEPKNVTFDIKVDNGKVDILGSSDRSSIFGNGEHLIKLKSNNGGIKVTK